MADEYSKIARDKLTVASSEDNHDSALDAKIKDLHTCLPGIIAKFDPVTQTAEVQPAIKRIFTEVGAVNLPLCVDVPVCFPGGGDLFLTFPVSAGDECILIFSERCIDGWAIDGQISDPEDYRQHDLSDAFAIVGVNSQPNKLANLSTTGTELRNRAGTVKLNLSDSGIVITGNVTITGDVTTTGALQNNGKNVSSTHKHSGVTTGAGQTGVVV